LRELDPSLDLTSFMPGPEDYAWTFGGVAPIHQVRPGMALDLWSDDAFCGRLRSTSDLASASLDMPYVNPQTGPFFVVGAEPGDTLVLHIADLEPARDWGASALIPFFGGLTSTDRTATLQPALPERTWIYQLDRAAGTVRFEASTPDRDLTVDLPLEPMLGTVGVAPAAGEVRSSLVPDSFGGNMDTPEMKPGTTVYLRVNVEGALFSLGDGHYRQGEGESCGTAVEGAMRSLVIVDLLKTPGPAWPRLESDTHWSVIGSARPLEDAWRTGQVEAVRWIEELTGLDTLDAYQLLSQISETPLANAVDVNYSVATKIPKRLLPARTAAYDGVHQRMRALVRG